jgi:malate dehydrogenase (oxaloacetate-decarboxylating)
MVKLTPNASYSLAIRLSYPNQTGMLGKITSAIAQGGGNIGDIILESQTRDYMQRQFIVDNYSDQQGEEVLEALRQLPHVEILEARDRTFELHRGGKLHIQSRIPVKSQSDLAMAYTPGVGRVCRAIAQTPEKVFSLTIKSNTVAVVTDGSAVLGLGNLGAAGALPVMEGKAILFKEFADLDSFPICLDTQDTEAIINTIKHIAPVFE